MIYLSKKQINIVNIIVISIIITTFAYLFTNVINTSYIGIRISNNNDKCIVKRVFSNGLAENNGIDTGSEIIEINGEEVYKNQCANKWLIIERIQSIKIKANNKVSIINFNKESFNEYKMILIFILVAGFLLLIFRISKNGIYSKRMLYYYLFCVNLSIILISLIPSSLGISFARVLFIISISNIPIIFFKILSYFIGIDNIKQYKIINIVLSIIGLFNSILSILNVFFNLHYIFKEYLSLMPIYFVVLFCIFLTIFIAYYCKKNKIAERYYYKESIFLIITGLLPLLLFYIIPTKFNTSYLVLIIFIGNIVICFLQFLITTKAIKVNFKIHSKICYGIFSLYLTLITISFISIEKSISVVWLWILIFLELYFILNLLGKFIKIIDYKNSANNDMEIFIAEEKEREQISEYVHDVIIQEVIYNSLILKDREDEIKKEEVIKILDDVIYSLRELCIEVYPMMILELGLIRTIKYVIDDFMKKHNIIINFIINDFNEQKLNNEEKNFVIRSIKELINNAIKHGEAEIIYVTIYEKNDNIIFTVKDDGEYIENDIIRMNHFGFNTLKNKVKLLGGEIIVETYNGTEIKIILPR